MPYDVTCPSCQAQLKLKSPPSAGEVRCPRCQGVVPLTGPTGDRTGTFSGPPSTAEEESAASRL